MSDASTNPETSSSTGGSSVAAWRILLRMLAGFIAMFSFAFWAAAGWNLGWTKTQIVTTEIEPITEIPHVIYKDHFAPGVELFGAALFVCVVLFVVTFIRRKNHQAPS